MKKKVVMPAVLVAGITCALLLNPAVAQADTDCGSRVSVGANTTCDFGLAVSRAFLSGSRPVVAVSPVTGQSYVMNCVQLRQRVECTGGNDAVVDLW